MDCAFEDDGAGCGGEVVGEDGVFGGVCKEESLVVQHPANTVGDGDGVLHGMAGEVGVEAEEGALTFYKKERQTARIFKIVCSFKASSSLGYK